MQKNNNSPPILLIKPHNTPTAHSISSQAHHHNPHSALLLERFPIACTDSVCIGLRYRSLLLSACSVMWMLREGSGPCVVWGGCFLANVFVLKKVVCLPHKLKVLCTAKVDFLSSPKNASKGEKKKKEKKSQKEEFSFTG